MGFRVCDSVSSGRSEPQVYVKYRKSGQKTNFTLGTGHDERSDDLNALQSRTTQGILETRVQVWIVGTLDSIPSTIERLQLEHVHYVA